MIIDMHNDACLLSGGKAKGLYELSSMGYSVPEFFVITSDTFEKLLDSTSACEKGSEAGISEADKIRALVFPEEFLRELDEAVRLLSSESYAVRSSAAVEDGKERSYAGQFESVLSVTKDTLVEAIRTVWLSAYSPKGDTAYSADGVGEISVIVQRQIDAEYAGVCFSTSPSSSDSVLIEYVEGLGEKLVSGEKKPTKIEAEKDVKLDNPLFEELKNTAVELEKRLKYPLDFEFAVSADRLYLLQMRPLTTNEFSSFTLEEGSYSMYVKRDFPWYIHSVQIKASLPEEQLVSYGFSTPIFEGALIFGEEYYSERADRLTSAIFDRLSLKDFRLFDRRISRLLSRVKKATEIISRLPSSLSHTELVRITEFFESIYLESYVPMMMRPDDYLCEKLLSLAPECDTLRLSYVPDYTDYRGQNECFSRIIGAYRSGKPTYAIINKYLKKYEYLLSPEDRTPEAVLSRCEAMKESPDAVDSRRENALKRRSELKKLSPEARKYANLLSRFVYYRTRVAECSDKLYYYGRSRLFPLIAKETGIDGSQLEDFGHGELTALVRGGTKPTGLQIRSLGHFAVWREGVPTVGFGLPPKDLVSRLKGIHNEDASVIRGEAASLGRVSGKVKIVSSVEDARELSVGEIMVSSMTTPDYTVAFSRAAGFITDEGGISCHASIIARELSVPCIVGTKNATTLLCDGDTVILDAYEGTVTVLERADSQTEI